VIHGQYRRRDIIAARERAKAAYPNLPREQLPSLCKSKRVGDRLFALEYMQWLIEKEGPDLELFRLAERMIPDPSNNCRWHAVITVGEMILTYPDRIWRIIKRYGVNRDEDMRVCIGVCLLEHLLELDWPKWSREVRLMVRRSRFFADTLNCCWSILKLPWDRRPRSYYFQVKGGQIYVKPMGRGYLGAKWRRV
jgi:hypothetical protein